MENKESLEDKIRELVGLALENEKFTTTPIYFGSIDISDGESNFERAIDFIFDPNCFDPCEFEEKE